METSKIKELLQKYFNGESTIEEERHLENLFPIGEMLLKNFRNIKNSLMGSQNSPNSIDDSNIEDDVMEYILENEHQEKTKYRWLWQTVTGIAASIIIVLGVSYFFNNKNLLMKL